jgi:hypothetical protein
MELTNIPLRKQMSDMAVGECIIAASNYKGMTVRNYASVLNAERGCDIRVHLNRQTGKYEITRHA